MSIVELNDNDIFIHATILAANGTTNAKDGNACVRRFINTFGTAELVRDFDQAIKESEDEYKAEKYDDGDDLPPNWN